MPQDIVFEWLLPLTMYQGALVLVLAGPFCYFSFLSFYLLSKSIPLFRSFRQKCQKLWMEACQGKMANCCWVGKGWGVVVGRWPCMSWHTIQGGVRIKEKLVVSPLAPLAKLAFLSVAWLDQTVSLQVRQGLLTLAFKFGMSATLSF